VTRIDIAGSIKDRKPVNIGTTFPASQDRVYCYLELSDVARDQRITYAWTMGRDTERITQRIKQSKRWRTWAFKSVAGRKGDWKVDVLDESGKKLGSRTFKVE